MPKCDIRTEISKNQKEFSIGDVVNGKVYVSISEEVECKGLTASLKWRTHGRGNRDSESYATTNLFSGKWQPGEYSYDFSLKINESVPATYHGHYINIDHMVHAQADIPWAIDPRANSDIAVKKINTENHIQPSSETPLDLSHKSAIGNIIIMIFLLIFGSVFAFAGYQENSYQSYIFVFIGIGIIIYGLYIGLYRLINNKLANKKLGKIEAKLSNSTFRLNEHATFSLRFRPNQSVKLNSIKVILKGQERATSGSGTNRKTYKHEFFNKEFIIENSQNLRERFTFERNSKIQIPDNIPPTFSSFNNSIEWSVSLNIDIDNWPDWAINKPIRII